MFAFHLKVRTILLLLVMVMVVTAVTIYPEKTVKPVPFSQNYTKAGGSFAPGTSQEYIQEFLATLYGSQFHEPDHNAGTHWSPASTALNNGGSGQGDSLALTWSIIPDGTTMSDGRGTCTSDLIATFDAVYGSNVWRDELRLVFDAWSDSTGLQYVEEANDDGADWPYTSGVSGVRGDIRIGGCNIDGNYGVLGYNYFPSNGDMKLDSTDSYFGNPGTLATGVHNVMSHEHGHGLGLYHVCPINQTKLMEPYATTAFVGLQHDDIRGGQRMYGDPNELVGAPNDSYTNATNLVSPSDNQIVTLQTISIDDGADEDWYTFSVAAGKQISLTVSPVGFSYEDGDQNSTTGACEPGPIIDSSEINDLKMQLIDSDGVTVLATVDLTGLGADETITWALGNSGAKYIRVYGDNSVDEVQLYDLSFFVEPEGGTLYPELTLSPMVVTSTQTANIQIGKQLTIENTGAANLTWQIQEDIPSRSVDVLLINTPQATNETIDFILDDGSVDSVTGFGLDTKWIWFNRFTLAVTDFPFELDEVSVLFHSLGATVGETVDIYIYEDTDGDDDPTTGATPVGTIQNAIVQATDGSTFSVYTLDAPIRFDGPGDLLIGVVNSGITTGTYPATEDTDLSQQRSWFKTFTSTPANAPALTESNLIDNFGSAGNWMIRGQGTKNLLCESPSDISWLSLASTSGTISAGNSMTVDLTFNSNGLSDGTYTGVLCVESNDLGNLTTQVPLTLTVDSAATYYGVTLSPDDAQSGLVGTTVTYTLNITNTGNVADTFNLSASGNGWTTEFSSSTVALSAGEETAVFITVSIPAEASDSDQDIATITATSQNDGNATASSDLTTTAEVSASYGVTLSPDDAQSGLVGTTVTYTLNITNTGNEADTFDLSASGNGWTTGFSSSTVALSAGEETAVFITVTIPAEASDSDQDIVTITATSQNDANAIASSDLTTTAEVSASYGVTLSPNDAQSGLVGTTVTYTLNITNTGNEADTFDLSVGSNSWVTTLSDSSVALSAGKETAVFITVTIPAEASDSDQDSVTITATSQNDGNATASTVLTTTVEVSRKYIYLPTIIR